MEAQLGDLERKFEEQTRASAQKFDEIMRMMQMMKDSMATPRNEDRIAQPKLGYNPKLEFPKFDGSNVRVWVKKCCKYFDLCKIPNDQKVDLASLNMIGKAETWVTS